jgi:hypothetical protein
MTEQIPINIAVEDELSEVVARKLLQRTGRAYVVANCYRQRGFGYLKKKIAGFNQAAISMPFLILTDLDEAECPATLVREWLPTSKHHHNLLFRVVVREVEAWLLADRTGIAGYLGVSETLIPRDPESLPDPKSALIRAAERSRSRVIRDDLVPRKGITVKQGPNYNGRLCEFVETRWNIIVAKKSASSLDRAIRKLESFNPA